MQLATVVGRVRIRVFVCSSFRPEGGIRQEHAHLQSARRAEREQTASELSLSGRHRMIELPPVNIKRWTIRRKAAVVTAVAAGEISREEVCRRYQISEEEFLAWQRAYETYGLPGLRSTRLQQYRRTGPHRGTREDCD